MVMYPGWFVKVPDQRIKIDDLVLNPKVLPSFLEKPESRLSLEDIKLITYHLSRHIRTAG
jgi:hypothetical protein